MLKRKNKEKKIYKDKNASLQLEKQRLYIALRNKDKEIERLTELCNKYEEEHKTTFETWQKDIKENKRLHSIIKEVREYIMKHCVNEKVSKEVGFKCYTMADTNELEHIMKIIGDNDE